MNSKWNSQKPSIFGTMTQLAIKHNAVNLAQGFPDFDGPEEIKFATKKFIDEGFNQYAPSNGIPKLREIFSDQFAKNYDLKYDKDRETTIFSGATEALFCAALAFLEPGDELLTFEPFYESYESYPFATQGTLIGIPLEAPSWNFSFELFEKKISHRTKAILLNSPHNPTGKVFSKKELEFISQIAIKHNLLVITDEVYDRLVYDSNSHTPIATLEGMKERTLTIQSTSKTFSLTGWKVGCAFGPESLIKAMTNVHQNLVFCSSTPLQWGFTSIENLPDSYYKEFLKEYNTRRDLLVEGLKKFGFQCEKPQGSYFLLANYEKISNKPDFEFCNWLTEKVKVATIPISGFYSDKVNSLKNNRYIRLGFCKKVETIKMALDNFDKYLPR